MVNLTRTWFDVPHGVRRRHLLDDVSLPDALLARDKESFDDAVWLCDVDFVEHGLAPYVIVATLGPPAAALPTSQRGP